MSRRRHGKRPRPARGKNRPPPGARHARAAQPSEPPPAANLKAPRLRPDERVASEEKEASVQASLSATLAAWLPQPMLRLELVRIFAPLAILGFMSSRLAYATHWIGGAGYRVPEMSGDDWRQPLYIAPLPDWAAWTVAALMVGSGLALSLGWRARRAAVVFAATLAFVALSDRLAAFTVSKLAPAIAIALALSPCGESLGIDAWRARRRRRDWRPQEHDTGAVRFVQVFLAVFYSASGIAKLQGDWLDVPHVLFSHVHDSYQTWFTWVVANAMPSVGWTFLQGVTLIFEVGAPLWFALPKTRTLACCAGVAMHVLIGLMFGPVKWFALLMITLLVAAYAPWAWLERLEARWLRPAGAET
jgi:uncharacterized membrane protein YphA (DoxX/SURF4 family)